MQDYQAVAKNAAGLAIAGAVFALVLFGIIAPMPLPCLLAALTLIPVGGACVGALVTLSFQEEDDH